METNDKEEFLQTPDIDANSDLINWRVTPKWNITLLESHKVREAVARQRVLNMSGRTSAHHLCGNRQTSFTDEI